MSEPAPHVERAWQYGHGDSSLHRLGPGWKSGLTLGFGAFALSVDSIAVLAGMGLAIAAAYAWAGLGRVELWKDARWLLVQAVLIVGLTVAVAGREAFAAGLRTALQLTLLFMPAALMLRTTSPTSLQQAIRRRLPERLAFATGATLRFVPVFVRETGELVEMQRLRGARLHARDLWRVGAWRDWLACVVFPMTVRCIEIAHQAAEAAEMRGVGRATREPLRTAPTNGGTIR